MTITFFLLIWHK